MSWGKFFKAVGKVIAASSAPPPKSRPTEFPIMTMDMIDSKGQPITKAQAVKLYKEFMLKVGFLDKDVITDYASAFADEITMHEETLTQDVESNINDLKEQLKDLKAQRKGETDPETKAELDDEISSLKDEIECEATSIKPAKEALAAFKNDKRQFLISYVNDEVQGR